MINKNGTWKFTLKFNDKHLIGANYRTKLYPYDYIHKHKARLVFKNFH